MRRRSLVMAIVGTMAAVACGAGGVPALAAPIGGGGGGGGRSKAPPRVNELVVFPNGTFRERNVTARRARARIGHRRCAIAQATPLAALLASRVARVSLHDYGSCSRRPKDASGLFVRKLGRYANRGEDGWVYKVGHRTGSAGAADPSGPFGHGRLKYGTHLLWFYCHMKGPSCQRTLSFDEVDTQPPGGLIVRVGAYDDRGRGIPAAGVTVHVGLASAVTDANGLAHVTAPVGTQHMYADGGGYVRSFVTRVGVQ